MNIRLIALGTLAYAGLFIGMLIIADTSYAEIYKWVDDKGQVHFSDTKPVNQAVIEIEEAAEITSYQSVSYGTVASKPTRTEKGMKVVMFSTSWCGYCKVAKKYFNKNGIRFTEYDVEKSRKGKKLYSQLGATGVPVILVGDKRMNGFSESGFERLYQ